LHWALAVPFLTNLTTAAILVTIYNPHPVLPFRSVFSWVHRLSRVCLFLLPLLSIVRHRGDFRMYVRHTREAWRWTLNDVKWLFLMGPATLNSKISLPHQGKFNAAEKMNYMVLTLTYPCYLITGVLIWLPGVALGAWLMHFSMALVATPLILGHIFMATINRDTRVGMSGMISGLVARKWAKHHYRLWYDGHHGHTGVAEPVAAGAEPVAEIERPAAFPELVHYATAEMDAEAISIALLLEATARLEDTSSAETHAPAISRVRPVEIPGAELLPGPHDGADLDSVFVTAVARDSDRPLHVETGAVSLAAPGAVATTHRVRHPGRRGDSFRPRTSVEQLLAAEIAAGAPMAHVEQGGSEDTT
jgi:formate dehydrogenase gamma subunit